MAAFRKPGFYRWRWIIYSLSPKFDICFDHNRCGWHGWLSLKKKRNSCRTKWFGVRLFSNGANRSWRNWTFNSTFCSVWCIDSDVIKSTGVANICIVSQGSIDRCIQRLMNGQTRMSTSVVVIGVFAQHRNITTKHCTMAIQLQAIPFKCVNSTVPG